MNFQDFMELPVRDVSMLFAIRTAQNLKEHKRVLASVKDRDRRRELSKRVNELEQMFK